MLTPPPPKKKEEKMRITYHIEELKTENMNHLYDLFELDAKIKYIKI
jgi:hypothetical protein